MKIYRKLQRLGSKEPLPCHYNTVLATIKRVLGDGPTDPRQFEVADNYAEKYLSYNLRRKEASPYNVEVDVRARKAETLKGFLWRECVNRHLNLSRTFGYDPLTGEYTSDLIGDRILYEARAIVRDILGDEPDYEAVVNSADFGNGASASLKRGDAQRQRKFEHGLSATRGLLSFAAYVVGGSPAWSNLLYGESPVLSVDRLGNTFPSPAPLKRVLGAVLDFVPKTADVDRIILKEPELNGFVQKGIGRCMRRKLQHYSTGEAPDGVDLNRSGDLNSELARAGSTDGHIATVDAERASDSISLALCDFILPPKWYKLCLAARSPYCIYGGVKHRLEMMSGMGNGFTFELESIIFYAIGLACSRRSKLPFAGRYVSIHGDDLTVPSDVMWFVKEAYSAAGISMNKGKSFGDGPFRESCGGHFFNGSSVKPFYVKASTGINRGDWFWLSNSLLLWLLDRSTPYLLSAKGRDLIEILTYIRWYSTSGNTKKGLKFTASFDHSRRAGIFSYPPRSTGASYKVCHLVDIPRKDRFTDHQSYVAWLCSPQVSPTPFELVLNVGQQSDAYGFNLEVDERQRWTRYSSWSAPDIRLVPPPLWAVLSLHKGQHH